MTAHRHPVCRRLTCTCELTRKDAVAKLERDGLHALIETLSSPLEQSRLQAALDTKDAEIARLKHEIKCIRNQHTKQLGKLHGELSRLYDYVEAEVRGYATEAEARASIPLDIELT